MPNRQKITALALTLGLSLTALVNPLQSDAHAAPLSTANPHPADSFSQHNKYTFTRTHVDAPKAFWNYETNGFELLATYPVRDEEGDIIEHAIPIDYTRNWVGKGWRGSTPTHLYTVPAQNWARFLGENGKLLYAAPQSPGDGNTPIWSGFGADADIPTNRLRDGEFSLNLISVDGPGKVEYFITSPTGASVRRFFSSHDTNYRETLLDLAQHTHNFTTFTKPGTYQLTFQAYARDKNGNPVVSRPHTQEWRVGGNDPRQDYTQNFRSSFNAAATAQTKPRTGKPQLEVKPVTNPTNPGDQYYTEFSFNSGNPADSGVLVITIDGYQLLQLPVQAGKATGSEMLGDDISNYQAIFIPATTAPSPRWASAQFSYQRNQGGVVQKNEAAEIAAPSPIEPAPVKPLQAIDLKNPEIDLSFTPVAEEKGKYRVRVAAKDPNFKGRLRGGFQRSLKQPNYDCFVELNLETAVTEQILDLEYCQTGFNLKFDLKPYPSINAQGIKFTKQLDLTNAPTETITLTASPLKSDFPTFEPLPNKPQDGKTEIPGDPQNETPGSQADDKQPPADPHKPPHPKEPLHPKEPNKPDSPKESSETTPRQVLRLSRGHLDIAALDNAEKVRIVVKDDTLQHANQNRVTREPQDLELYVPRAAQMTRASQQGGKEFDFLGKVGENFYLLPEVQDHQLLWPGFSTEALDYSYYPQGVDFEITAQNIPQKGRATGFSVDPLTQQVQVFFDTAKPGSYRLHTAEPTHRHLNWSFTKPGTYKLAVRLLAAGKQLGTTQVLTFQVAEKKKTEGEAKQPPQDKTASKQPAGNTPPESENTAESAGTPQDKDNQDAKKPAVPGTVPTAKENADTGGKTPEILPPAPAAPASLLTGGLTALPGALATANTSAPAGTTPATETGGTPSGTATKPGAKPPVKSAGNPPQLKQQAGSADPLPANASNAALRVAGGSSNNYLSLLLSGLGILMLTVGLVLIIKKRRG